MAHKKIKALSEQRCKIILSLAANNMNVSETARQLHFHRNTLVYNIERIHKLTGYNPLKFWDLHELAMLIIDKEESE